MSVCNRTMANAPLLPLSEALTTVTGPYGSGRASMSLEILPSVDLRDGRVVRLKQGDYSQQINYSVDPLDTARAFRDAGAKWMHVVDLDGAKEGRPVQTDLIAN